MPPAFFGSEHTHSTLSQRGYEVVAFDDKETNPPLGFILRHLLASKLTKTGRIQIITPRGGTSGSGLGEQVDQDRTHPAFVKK